MSNLNTETKPERVPSWMGMEYGWDTTADVNWPMLHQNLAAMDNILGNPAKFPKANMAFIEKRSHELHAFLACNLYRTK